MRNPVITAQVVKLELAQREEEGCDVAALRGEVEALEATAESERDLKAERLFRKLEALRPSDSFPYREPSELEEIRSLRPDGPRVIANGVGEEKLLERTRGAWLGRCAGCMLGKPVEGWPKARIESILRNVDEYPLCNYFPQAAAAGLALDRPRHFSEELTRGGIKAAVRDDDTDYTLLGLHTVESASGLPSSEDIVKQWLQHLPFHRVYSAERAAYRNFVDGILPPESARVINPYREWIGAQIRADIWGYLCPGEPERAAEMAFRDARISHVKNGIYGEMFVAALIAAALVLDDVQEAIRVGLSEIPAGSRLAEAIRNTVDWSSRDSSWEQTWQRVFDKYGHYRPVHTIHNAAFVTLALLHGGKDFTQAISIAVMCGLDTDCNGATAGSIMGAMFGPGGIPEHWSRPLNDTLMTALADMTTTGISDLAARTRKAAGLLKAVT